MAKGEDKSRVVFANRTGPIIAGSIQSRSDRGKKHFARAVVGGTILCGCEASRLGGFVCHHIRSLLDAMSKEDLIDAILEGAADPDNQPESE